MGKNTMQCEFKTYKGECSQFHIIDCVLLWDITACLHIIRQLIVNVTRSREMENMSAILVLDLSINTTSLAYF